MTDCLCVFLLYICSLRLRGEEMSPAIPSQATSRWLALPFPDQTVGRVDKSLSSVSGPQAGQFSDEKAPIHTVVVDTEPEPEPDTKDP